MTIKNKRQEKIKAVREKIKAKLGLTETQINTIVFECAELYMERLSGVFIADMFLQAPSFWTWWLQQWMLVDEVIMEQNTGMTLPEYRRMHLGIEFFPDDVIIDLIKKEVNVSFRIDQDQKQASKA